MLEQHSGNGYKCPGATFSTVNRKTGKFTSADEQDFTLWEQNLSALINRVPRPSWSPPRPSPRDPKKTNLKLILKEMLFLLHPSYQPITEPISQNQLLKFVKLFLLSSHLRHSPQLLSQNLIIGQVFLPVSFPVLLNLHHDRHHLLLPPWVPIVQLWLNLLNYFNEISVQLFPPKWCRNGRLTKRSRPLASLNM